MSIVIDDGVIPIRARDDTAAGVAQAQRRVSNLRGQMKVDADIAAAERGIRKVESDLTRLRSKPSSVQVDADIAAAERKLAQLRQQAQNLGRLRESLRIEANTAPAREQLVRLEAQSARTSRSLRDIHRAAGGLSFGRAAKGISIFGGLAAAAGAAGAAIAAIPAAGAALGGMIGVLAGSFSGVGNALNGYKADQEAAASASRSGAAAALSSATQIRDAQAAVADARRNAAEVAQQGAEQIADAERAAARAAVDGAQQIADAERAVARAAADGAQQVADAKRDQARTALDTARAVADAQQQQEDTARQGADAITAASGRVEEALERQEEAQENLTDAYRDAGRALDDLREKVSDYALDQEGAAIRVVEAEQELRDTLADSAATALDRRKAEYELAVAKERVSDLTREQTEATTELADAERKGIAGSDLVVDAQGRFQDAVEGTRDAQRDLATTTADTARANQDAAKNTARVMAQAAESNADAARTTARAQQDAAEANADAARNMAQAQQDAAQANADAARDVQDAQQDAARANRDAAEQVQDALQGVQDAMASQAAAAQDAAGANSKFADAMAKLSPAGRAFVHQLLRMKPLIDGLKRTSQEAFLPGLTQMLRDSEGLFPTFNGFLRDTGTIMGDSARQMGELFKATEFRSNLQTLLDSSLPITRELSGGLVSLTDKVVEFGARMAPASAGFARFLDDTISGFEGMLDELAPHADSFRRIWEALGRIMEVVLPLVGELVGWLADRLAPALESLAGFLERNRGSLDEWALAIGGAVLAIKGLNLVVAVTKWAQGISAAIGSIGGTAKTADGKVGGLRGSLQGLKSIGRIGVTIAATYVGFELISGLIDGSGQGKARLDTDKSGDVGTAERGKALLSGDFSGIGNTIRDDIASNPILPEGMNANPFVIPEPPAHMQKAWDDFWGGLGESVSGFAQRNGLSWGQVKTAALGRAGELQAGVSGWWGRTFTDSDSWFNQTKTSIGGHMSGARDWAVERASSAQSGVSGWWGRTFTDSDSWFNRTKNSVGGHMSGARDWAVERAGSAKDGISGWWGRTFTDSDSWFNRTKNTVSGHMGEARDRAVERAGSAKDGISGWWGRTFADSDSTFSRIRNTVSEKMREAKDNVTRWAGDAWRGVSGWFGRMWDDVQRMGRDGVNGVIKALNWLSDKGNVVLRFLKVPEIPRIALLEAGGTLGPQMLAAGGRVGGGFTTNGPQAIVGEGKRSAPEYVIPTDPKYRARALDLYQSLGSKLMADGGTVPQLADGGILGWIGGGIQSAWRGVTGFASGVGDKLSDVMSWVGDVAGGLSDSVLNAVRGMLPGEPWRGMGAGLAKSAFEGIKKKINDSFMVSFDPGGTGVERWAPLVLRALSMLGQPASYLGITLRRMNQESGGNPTIFNNWDSNAAKGTPSGGLMQTIWPTFQAHHHPGTSWNMLDPLANILASMRYALSRYGSLPAAYNRPGGYATGGTIPGSGSRDNQLLLAQPGERVLTQSQNAAFERLVEWLDKNEKGRPGRSQQPVQVVVNQVAGDPQETGRFVALSLRQVA